MAKKEVEQEIHVPELRRGIVRLRIIGQTPMFQNRMAAKAKQQLLVGGRKKTAADRVQIKHHPAAEFRDSLERMREGPTALGLRVVAMKAAMCTAALETSGITKTSAQRLLFMPGDLTALYGVPQLRMDCGSVCGYQSDARRSDKGVSPQWGAEIEIHHVLPQLPVSSVVTLACNAGVLIGLGDFRQEKGKGAFGSFRVITPDMQDDEWDELVANHGRGPQLAAIDNPEYADEDTAELMEYFHGEEKRRAA